MWTNTPRLIQSQLEQRFWWALPRSAPAVLFSSVSRLSSPSGLHCERLRCPDHISDRSLPRSKAKGWALKGSGRNAGSGALVRVLFPDKSIGNLHRLAANLGEVLMENGSEAVRDLNSETSSQARTRRCWTDRKSVV